MILRDYQEQAVQAILDEFEKGTRSTLCVLPTGMGKTEIFCSVAHRMWEAGKGRAMFLCPDIGLVGQAAKRIRKRIGLVPDIEQAHNWANENGWGKSEMVVSCKPTMVSKIKRTDAKRFERFKDFGLLIIDEAHLAATKQFKEIVDHFLAQGANVLGTTATPLRHDRRALKQIFQTTAFSMFLPEAIEQGWLVGCKAKLVRVESLSLSEVRTQGGDFVQHELGHVMEDEKVCHEIAAVTAREIGGDKTVVYCASVDQAEKTAKILKETHQIKSEFICSDPKRRTMEDRKHILQSFEEDQSGIQVVCNVGILTTGWDFPGLKHLVMARPTKSISLYTQCLGRATRPLEGIVDFEGSTPELRKQRIAESDKPHFRVTDLVDNSLQNKIVSSIDILGGRFSLEEIERAKDIAAESTEEGSPEEALEKARQELNQEAEEAAKKIKEDVERERLRRIRAEVEYSERAVSPFDAYQAGAAVVKKRGARLPFGKHCGELVSDQETGYLESLIGKYEIRAPWLRKAIERELVLRGGDKPSQSNHGPATDQQKKVLAKYGYQTEVTYQKAAQCIKEINQKLSSRRTHADSF